LAGSGAQHDCKWHGHGILGIMQQQLSKSGWQVAANNTCGASSLEVTMTATATKDSG